MKNVMFNLRRTKEATNYPHKSSWISHFCKNDTKSNQISNKLHWYYNYTLLSFYPRASPKYLAMSRDQRPFQ